MSIHRINYSKLFINNTIICMRPAMKKEPYEMSCLLYTRIAKSFFDNFPHSILDHPHFCSNLLIGSLCSL